MANESQVLQVVSGGTDKVPTAQVKLVDENGDALVVSSAVAAEDITDITATGEALVTAEDAAAGRTALGLGDLAVESLAGIAGYDAEETQTLKHVEGVLTWVTDA